MAVETTLSILKPDAVERNLVGQIIAHFEQNGLRPVAIRRTWLSRAEAEAFYAVHSHRSFFGELVEYMTRSPVVILALRGEDAVLRNRELMGATNPANAAEGTIRKLFALSVGENSVHGSDGPEAATREIALFFKDEDIVG